MYALIRLNPIPFVPGPGAGWLSVLVLALSLSFGTAQAAGPLGNWEGSLSMGKFSMRMLLEIAGSEEEGWEASVSYPERGVRGIPVDAILYNAPEVLVEFDQMGGLFRGRFDSEFEVLEGSWKFQGPQGPGPGAMGRDMRFERAADESGAVAELDYKRPAEGPMSIGYWIGRLSVMNDIVLQVHLRVGRTTEGALSGYLDLPEQGGRDLTLKGLQAEGTKLEFEVPGMGMRFVGELGADGTTLSGKMNSFNRELPIEFEQVDSFEAAEGPPLSYEAPDGSRDLRGYWLGTLEVQGVSLRLALAIGREAGGAYRGTMDSLDQNARGLAISEIAADESGVRLTWRALGAEFKGQLEAEGMQLSGEFTQGPVRSPLTFKRTSGPEEANQ